MTTTTLEKFLKRLTHRKEGQGMTEYILILMLIAIGTISAVRFFGDTVRINYGKITKNLQGQTYDGQQYDDVGDIEEATKSRDLKNFDE